MIRYLREIQKRYATVTSFFVSEHSHQYYHSSGILKTVSVEDPQDQWYFNMAKVIPDYQINIDRDTADLSNMTVFINHKVYDYLGNYIGTIGVGLAVSSVKNLIETYQQRYGRTIFFTDRQGQVTLIGNGFSGPKNLREMEGLEPLVTQILTSPSSSLTIEQHGQKVYFNSRKVEEFNWYLIVLEHGTPGEARLHQTLLVNIAISLIITLIILAIAAMTLGNYQKRLETMATTDRLTGITSRQMFEVLYNQTHKTNLRRQTPLSLLIVDIDHFKQVNDTYGHPAGDQVLQGVARALNEVTRGDDVLFRWGGEEFLILLSNCSIDQARTSAERFRERIEDLTLYRGDTTLKVTISVGAAQLQQGENIDNLISRADKALYLAKTNGRNRVEA
jgi:diguanylate cyclase (GGDEF)-like protein